MTCLLFLWAFSLTAFAAEPAWTTFHGDAARSGNSGVGFATPPFSRLWTYSLGRHTYHYCRGASVWSSCAVAGEVKGRTLVYIGAYEHSVYCLDALTGEEVWRFTTGCLVNAAPVFAVVGERPLVFVASADRCFYALDAGTGAKVWMYETYPWNYTVGESIAGSPLAATVDGRAVLIGTMWNSDARPLRTVQSGELFAFDAAAGRLLWRRKLSTASLTSPAFAEIDGRPMVFVGGEDGGVQACDARTGAEVWRTITDQKVYATPVVIAVEGRQAVLVANNFGMLRCLSAVGGREIWKYKAGHEVLSTPAVVQAGDKQVVLFGAGDRCIHAVHAKSGRPLWPQPFATGKYVVASPAIATVQGHPVIFVNSLDNNLYMLDVADGCEIMRFASGDMLWPYETRGISIWSSPSVVRAGGRSIVLFPAHDGKLYAFADGAVDAPDDGSIVVRAWSDGRKATAAAPETPRSTAFMLLPVAGGAMILAALVMIFAGRRKER